MFQLTGGEALGVDVGQFLEFQGAFEGNGVADVASQEQDRGLVLQFGRQVEDVLQTNQSKKELNSFMIQLEQTR